MKSNRYPTRHGIAVPITEIWLPRSDLNIEKKKNNNNHHNSWTEKMFGKCVLFNTLRNLESQQFCLPLDVHDYLHEIYDPPKLPTPLQAVTEIERAKEDAEKLLIRERGVYIKHKLCDEVMKQVIHSYDELRRRE
jgi:hypothetical protein